MLCMFNRLSLGVAVFGAVAAGVAQTSNAALLVDGSFENQAVLQGNPTTPNPMD